MNTIIIISILILSITTHSSSSTPNRQNFINCVTTRSEIPVPLSTFHTPNTTTFSSVFHTTAYNFRHLHTNIQPDLIFTPLNHSHVQAAILCSRNLNLHVRLRSGGHDFESLSYTSTSKSTPFILLDLFNFKSIYFEQNTAWVEAGVTLGELYYTISKQSHVHGFPAGLCSGVGVGGHFSGGGFGNLARKYGVSADNVIDVKLVDVNGRLLDRSSMGEDLFWAVRGGGGGSFGVVLSWKIKLVPVPEKVTVFTLTIREKPVAVDVLYRWQQIGYKIDENLFLEAKLDKKKTIEVSFKGLFLGGVNRLVEIVSESFPELGLKKQDCEEMNWVSSVLYFDVGPVKTSPEMLLQRDDTFKLFFKVKMDLVQEPMPKSVIEDLFVMLSEEDSLSLELLPYGGVMSRIGEHEIPYPHRNGILFEILYVAAWIEGDLEDERRHMDGIRKMYSYMTPYVSKNPRRGYINERDLDLGVRTEVDNGTSVVDANQWGVKYFNRNFERLIRVKSKVDPMNVFRHEQSIPVVSNQLEDDMDGLERYMRYW